MASPDTPRQVERKIYFYRADAGTAEDGTPVSLKLSSTIENISTMPFADGSKRYWTQRDGDAIALWVPKFNDSFNQFSLAAVRRSSLPQRELNGELKALNLGAGAGLHEPIHIKLFPNNLIGMEFNFYGPRPSRLPLYLKHADSESPDFLLETLLRKDVESRLRNHKEMRLLELYVRPPYVEQVREANKSLGDAFSALDKLSKADVIGLTLRPEPRQQTSLGKKILKGTKRLAARKDLSENVLRFKAKGVNESTGKVEVLNLLDDQLVSSRKIQTLSPTSRAVDPVAAYDAIQESYEELKTELLAAAGIRTSADQNAG